MPIISCKTRILNVCGTDQLLAVRLNAIQNINLDGGVLAQAIELQVDKDSCKYALGLSYLSGQAIGMVAHHSKGEIRRWGRIDFVFQTARRLLGDNMVGFTVVSNCPGMAEQFGFVWHNYQLNKPQRSPGDPLEKERLLLNKQLGILADGRAPDTSDP